MATGLNPTEPAADARNATLLESALRHDRIVLLIVLAIVPLVSWAWIAVMARDMYGTMRGPAAWMMTPAWDAPHLALLCAMWAVMMTAMMLPTAAPLVLLYAAAARKQADADDPAQRIYALAAGYLAVWSMFSFAAAALQRVLTRALWLTPMMEPSSARVGAVILAIAALYQLTPFKHACLRACRSPLGFMMQRWYRGVPGAFRLGVEHGGYCLGCCWALMLILFAGGVMNLAVIVALTVWVAVEKMAPFGDRTPLASGMALAALAIWLIAR